ncbi:MAG: class I adenylate-forming enzyme family protein [Pseudomonadota bacterium]
MRAPYSRTIFDLLCEQAERAPNGIAAVHGSRRVTYSELANDAGRLAAGLRDRGIQRADRVGLLSTNSIEWLEIFFATTALGATLVPFSTWSTVRELEFLIEDSRIRTLFLISRFGEQHFAKNLHDMISAGAIPAIKDCCLIDDASMPLMSRLDEWRGDQPLLPLPPGELASANDTLLLLYTSGSSNRPKSVPLDHFAAIENGFNIGERQGLKAGDRVLISIPMFWSYGAVNALPAVLSHGATLVLQDRFEPAGALDLIEHQKCTAIYTLPAMTNALTGHETFRPERTSSLRAGVTIGAPQDITKAANELGAQEICNIYGATENYGNCCVTPHHWPLHQRASCQGPPLPGVSIRIRDPVSGDLLGPGEVGEVEVRGYLTRGYDGNSTDANARSFTDDGYFRTSDLGSLDADGHMHFAGRRSEMIKRSGINVSPAEVEEVLQQHADVALAGVTGIEDESRGEIIVAYLVARPGHTITPEDVKEFCRVHLSRYKVPDRLFVAQDLPLTATGKLMRRELKALAAKGD